jgi:hypothetical protein
VQLVAHDVEVALGAGQEAERPGAQVTSTRSPGTTGWAHWPSTVRTTSLAWAVSSRRITERAGTTRGRLVSEWAQIGVSVMPAAPGIMIGPPAAML